MKNVASAYIERWNFVLGAIFVVIVVFMPEGLVPGTARLGALGDGGGCGRAPPRVRRAARGGGRMSALASAGSRSRSAGSASPPG